MSETEVSKAGVIIRNLLCPLKEFGFYPIVLWHVERFFKSINIVNLYSRKLTLEEQKETEDWKSI